MLNVHSPTQPGGSGEAGIGALPSVSRPGTPPASCVWLQDVGWVSKLKSTLWTAELVSLTGDVNVTFPPGVIVTELSPAEPAVSWKKLSPVTKAASVGASIRPPPGSPQASAGTPTSAMAAHTSHGKNDFRIPDSSPPDGPFGSRNYRRLKHKSTTFALWRDKT